MKYNKKRVITENFAEVVRRGVSQDPGSSEDTKHTRRAEKHLPCHMIITTLNLQDKEGTLEVA